MYRSHHVYTPTESDDNSSGWGWGGSDDDSQSHSSSSAQPPVHLSAVSLTQSTHSRTNNAISSATERHSLSQSMTKNEEKCKEQEKESTQSADTNQSNHCDTVEEVRAAIPQTTQSLMYDDNYELMRTPSPEPVANGEQQGNTQNGQTPTPATSSTHHAPSYGRRALNLFFPTYFLASAIASFVIPALHHEDCRTSFSTFSYGCGVSNVVYFFLSLFFLAKLPNDLSDLALQPPTAIVGWMVLMAVKQLIGMADFGWFLWGNYELFRSDSVACISHSSHLYRWVCVAIAQGYAGLIVPIIAFIFFARKYPEYVFPSREQLAATRADRQKPQHSPCPPALISACELQHYSPSLFPSSSDAQCAICLGSYSCNDAIRFLPCNIAHHFHSECIDEWLSKRNECPQCRRTMEDAFKERDRRRALAQKDSGPGVQPVQNTALVGEQQV